jgi:hypothetical protein
MKKHKIENSIKLPTRVKVYIQEDGTILIYDLLDDFLSIAYKINPDDERINYLYHIQKKNRVSNIKKNQQLKE